MSLRYGELRPTSGWDRFVSLVYTTANFNGFRVLAGLLHGTLAVGVSETLRRWTEGATYVWQGGHHVGHCPTFYFTYIFWCPKCPHVNVIRTLTKWMLVSTVDNILIVRDCLCAQNSVNIAQYLCSHSHVNKWIVVHFQPRTHIQRFPHPTTFP